MSEGTDKKVFVFARGKIQISEKMRTQICRVILIQISKRVFIYTVFKPNVKCHDFNEFEVSKCVNGTQKLVSSFCEKRQYQW